MVTDTFSGASPEPIIAFDNSYARLPHRLFARSRPDAAPAPALVRLNRELAGELGLDADRLESAEGVAILSGTVVPPGADPIAMAYAGHQFGSFVPQLGDGRAVLLGETLDRQGVRRDLQLKGSGRTVFSRGGDGKAALGPVLREYLVGEAMAALDIPTTRALAATLTGGIVFRERRLPGAILTRVARSHIRVGTFQYFAHRGDEEAVRALADYTIARLYPGVAEADEPILALFSAVCEAQARLVASWLNAGFVHGVMNTDNMAISGETIDYGPCAFMDAYDPGLVLSSIDRNGRYAFANQPKIAQWNLARFGECLLPLIDEDREKAGAKVVEQLSEFARIFEDAYNNGLSRKIGLPERRDGDLALVRGLLAEMQTAGADFTLAFRTLSSAIDGTNDDAFRALFAPPSRIGDWLAAWRRRLLEENRPPEAIVAAMNAINPQIIPRNHLVEEAIAAAVDGEDFTRFHTLVDALAEPFAPRDDGDRLTQPPAPGEAVAATFCGT